MQNGNNHQDKDDNIIRFDDAARQQEQWRKDYQLQKKAQKKAKLKQDIKEYAALFNLNLPPITKILAYSFIFIHVLLTITLWLFGSALYESFILSFSFIPASWTGAAPFYWTTPLSPITYMFLHGGWFHLFMNTVMLMAFGSATERFLGSRRMIKLFLICGLCGAGLHFLFYFSSPNPLIGASGGLSGLFAVILMLFQFNTPERGFKKHKKIIGLLAAWIIISLIFAFMAGGDGTSIAWAAHIGGFIGGLVLYKRF